MNLFEDLGADGFAHGTSTFMGEEHRVVVRISGRDTVRKGDTIHVTTDPESVHVFDTETGERLSA